jgi:hypothetical protein
MGGVVPRTVTAVLVAMFYPGRAWDRNLLQRNHHRPRPFVHSYRLKILHLRLSHQRLLLLPSTGPPMLDAVTSKELRRKAKIAVEQNGAIAAAVGVTVAAQKTIAERAVKQGSVTVKLYRPRNHRLRYQSYLHRTLHHRQQLWNQCRRQL